MQGKPAFQSGPDSYLLDNLYWVPSGLRDHLTEKSDYIFDRVLNLGT